MFDKLKKLFSDPEGHVDDGVYTEYDASVVHKYKEEFPDLAIDEVVVPDVPSLTNIRVKRWYKNDADAVRKGERLCELDAGKMTLELETYVDGYLYFRVRPGRTVSVGQVLCVILSKQPE
ncbi:MAG: lipoyl domain-containing protein [Bacteroidota bacterium]